jgi:hypothetical protein
METLDIALAAQNTDIVPPEFDGDPVDPNCREHLDYSQCMAFENFDISLDPYQYHHSNIDTYYDRMSWFMTPNDDIFYLFEFSAKLDPVPTMLVQSHSPAVAGFWGQNSGLRRSILKKYVIILAQPLEHDEVRYVHGNLGKGTFTFYAGHDPEDYQHQVGDPVTDLNLYKNSSGYRLILNNILFPAAQKKERKT